jgi:thiosulfate reductase cytochrome b subunit
MGGKMADRTTIIHSAWLRAMHWTNAAAMTVMVLSGWQIYDASPIFAFRFSHSITLGGWLGGGLLWHFATMWVLMLNGALYLIFGLAAGRFRRKLFPISPAGVLHDTASALAGHLSHDDLSMYNQVQRLLYVGIILVGILIVLTGLSMWKPVQFQTLAALFGGYDTARLIHFFCMAAIVVFFVVHVTLAILVPRSLRAMVIGH